MSQVEGGHGGAAGAGNLWETVGNEACDAGLVIGGGAEGRKGGGVSDLGCSGVGGWGQTNEDGVPQQGMEE